MRTLDTHASSVPGLRMRTLDTHASSVPGTHLFHRKGLEMRTLEACVPRLTQVYPGLLMLVSCLGCFSFHLLG
jgi:hypothetical protein